MKNKTINEILNNKYSENEQDEIAYVMASIIGDLTKIMLLAILFFIIGYLKEYLVATLVISILRVFCGGFHFNTYWSCLLFSLSNYVIIIGAYIKFHAYSSQMLMMAIPLSLILVLISPMLTKEKQEAFNYKRYNRVIPTIIIGIVITLDVLINNPLFIIGTISIIVLSIQNIIMKGVQIYEKPN